MFKCTAQYYMCTAVQQASRTFFILQNWNFETIERLLFFSSFPSRPAPLSQHSPFGF